MEKDKYQITLFSASFCQTLFIVFLVLKLCDVITWSWWWVTAPLWAPAVLIFGIVLMISALTFLWFVAKAAIGLFK